MYLASREVRRIPITQTYLFDISNHSPLQLRQFRYAMLSLLMAVIGRIKIAKYIIRNSELLENIEKSVIVFVSVIK